MGEFLSGRLKSFQQMLCLLVACLVGRTVQAIMADFGKTLRKHMLKKAGQEVGRRQGEAFDLLSAIFPVAKRHLAILKSL